MFLMSLDGKSAAKGVGVVKFPIETVLKYVRTTGVFPKCNDQCKEQKCLQITSEDDFRTDIGYFRYNGKWPVVSERDFIAVSVCQKIDDDKTKVEALQDFLFLYHS